ncbi:helix-turn-helix domain-containing protein [Streptomyces montanisoli]|uniref:Helix-turn-helix transcriptional regulator n=1 Tax=Streptomyces montanisoli TaxID=2798581 RepID=A0A940MIQ9_9ACTN|nr:helix-turn-helix transcriptional regulator [Streptomyces montanisoli]MBP0460437.1 helix-turn-helix transcriptional regulator [Streptomyces montanisoli]
MTSLGLTENSDTLYRIILARPDSCVASLATELGWPEERVRSGLDELADLSLLRRTPSDQETNSLQVLNPGIALDLLLSRQSAEVARRQQELAESRASAAAIIAGYVEGAAASNAQRTNEGVEKLFGVEAVQRKIAELADRAERETLSFALGGAQPAGSRAVAQRLLDRRIPARTVYPDSIRNDADGMRHAEWHVARGNRIRTAAALPMWIHIVDSAVALVPLDPADSSHGAAVIPEPGAVAAFTALYEAVWETAVPLGEPPQHGLEDVGSRHRELLRLLARGCTDEAAARRLGVSLRTERRLISELMATMEARSRFQLGQRAVERGYL